MERGRKPGAGRLSAAPRSGTAAPWRGGQIRAQADLSAGVIGFRVHGACFDFAQRATQVRKYPIWVNKE